VRAALDSTVKAFNLQEFRVALDDFRAAYTEQPDPIFLFNIAQAQRNLTQYEAAARSYRAYLNQSPNAPNRDQVLRLIEQMEKAAAEVRAKPPSTDVQSHTAVTPTISTSTSRDLRPWYKNPLGWSLIGIGVAAASVSVGLLVHASDLDHQLGSASSIAQVQQLQTDRDAFRVGGYATIGVSAASAVAGAIVLGVTAAHRRSTLTSISIEPFGSQGALVGVGGAW
jgi:hypothetical protein